MYWRKAAGVVVAALLVAAVFAQTATATESVYVATEDGGQPCTVFTCQVHMVSDGTVELVVHFFGFAIHQEDCRWEATWSVNANGSGQVSNFGFAPGDSSCTDIVPCDGSPWPFAAEATGPGEQGEVLVDLCINALVDCDGTLDITMQHEGGHVYEALVNDERISGSICEITGEWTTEGAAPFEIAPS